MNGLASSRRHPSSATKNRRERTPRCERNGCRTCSTNGAVPCAPIGWEPGPGSCTRGDLARDELGAGDAIIASARNASQSRSSTTVSRGAAVVAHGSDQRDVVGVAEAGGVCEQGNAGAGGPMGRRPLDRVDRHEDRADARGGVLGITHSTSLEAGLTRAIRVERGAGGVLLLSDHAYAAHLDVLGAAGVGYLLRAQIAEPGRLADAIRQSPRGLAARSAWSVRCSSAAGTPSARLWAASARSWQGWSRARATAASRAAVPVRASRRVPHRGDLA
jgi:hypothetical protein